MSNKNNHRGHQGTPIDFDSFDETTTTELDESTTTVIESTVGEVDSTVESPEVVMEGGEDTAIDIAGGGSSVEQVEDEATAGQSSLDGVTIIVIDLSHDEVLDLLRDVNGIQVERFVGDSTVEEITGELIMQARLLHEYPDAWSDLAVLKNIVEGVEPAKTSTGAWLEDQTRDRRISDDWSTAELEAWALGELEPTRVANETTLAVSLKARLHLKCMDGVKSVVAAYLSLKNPTIGTATGSDVATEVFISETTEHTRQYQESLAITAKVQVVEGLTALNTAYINETLQNYIDAVGISRPISENEARTQQNNLDNVLQYMIKLEPQAMVAAFEHIKPIFVKQMVQGGVFHANNVFRFTHLMRENDNRRARHVSLLELLRIYFGVNKGARNQCDVRNMLRFQPTDKVDAFIEYLDRIA